MKRFLCVSFFAMIMSVATAQWTSINHSLLSGCSDNGMVYTGTSVLVATEGGIFRSTDNGSSWQRSNAGLDTSDININDITYFNNKAWVSAGLLYSSANDGVSWLPVIPAGVPQQGFVAEIAKKGTLLFMVYYYWDNVLNTTVTALCYSSDGTNWTEGIVLDNTGSQYFEVLSDNDFACMFTRSAEDTLFYTTNGTQLSFIPKTGLPLTAQMKRRLFTIDPLGNNLFYNDENNATIYKYNFATQQWEAKMNGITGIAAIFGLNSLGNVCLASAYVPLPIPSIKLYTSLDTGNTWQAATNPGLLLPLFQGSMIKIGSNRIISTDMSRDIYLSDNNGQFWTKNTGLMSNIYSNIFIHSNGNVFTQRDNLGLLKSADNGVTWASANGDLPNFFGLYFAQEGASVGTDLFAISSQEPDGPVKLYKSTNNGTNWSIVPSAPDSSRSCLMGVHAGRLFVYFKDGNDQGTYQFTANQGTTWTNMTGIASLNLNKVLGFTANADTIFMFGRDNQNNKLVFRSVNNGQAFSLFTTGISQPGIEILINNEHRWDIEPNTVASFGPNNTGIYVAVRDESSFPIKVKFFTLNAQQNTWVEVNSTGVEITYNTQVHSLQNHDGVWYLATSIGIFASVNNMQNWGRVWNNQGLQLGMKNTALAIGGGYLFVGTIGTGIWKASLTPPVVNTNIASAVTGTQATSGGTLTNTGALPFIAKGLCWATNTNPTLNDDFNNEGWASESFVSTITGLTPSTPYYVRAYIITYNDTIYANQVSFSTTAIVNAQLIPPVADYGLSNPTSVTTGVMWNDASLITSIVDNQGTPYTLLPQDFSVNANLLTINQSYLSQLLTTAGQSVTLTVNFNVGSPATFVITAVQLAINHAQINPAMADFNLSMPANVITNISWNDASSITQIVDNQNTPYTLTQPGDYSVTGNTLIIYSSYLTSVLTSPGESIELTISFNVGNTATLLVTAYQPVISATINPSFQIFYLNAPADAKTTVTWNDATAITQITDNQTPPNTLSASDYTLTADTLFIHSSYLSSVLAVAGDSVELSISFDQGYLAKLKVKADIFVGLNSLSENLNVYPNPASNRLFVESNYVGSQSVEIYSVSGQLVATQSFTGNDVVVDVTALNNGSYVLRLMSGTEVRNFRFVILR